MSCSAFCVLWKAIAALLLVENGTIVKCSSVPVFGVFSLNRKPNFLYDPLNLCELPLIYVLQESSSPGSFPALHLCGDFCSWGFALSRPKRDSC